MHVSDEALENIVNAECTQPIPGEVERHLLDCSECQQRLLEFSVTPDWHREIVENCIRFRDEFRSGGSLETSAPETGPRGDSFDLQTAKSMLREVLTPPAHPELLGSLRRYDVEAIIGSGGMGVVLRGFDRELHRPVAIKMILPRLSNNGVAKQRFAREARASATVLHPNVIGIHDIGEVSGIPWFVMPLIVGPTLRSLVEQQGPLSEREIVRIGKQIASGLAAAHSQGLVHRDIKPDNVLVDNHINRVVITDFGLARKLSDEPMTQTGFLAGTIDYMSPEQSRGEIVDARSDLFSLGGVLFFLATGESPFSANSPIAKIHAIGDRPHAKVLGINNEISQTIGDLIDRLLEKDPDARFQSAADVESFMTQYLSHLQQPLVVRKPSLEGVKGSKESKKGKDRSWLRHCVWCLVAVLLFCGGLMAIWSLQEYLSPKKEISNSKKADSSAQSDPQGRDHLQPVNRREGNLNRLDSLDAKLQVWLSEHTKAWRELGEHPVVNIEEVTKLRKSTLAKFPPFSEFMPRHLLQIKKSGLLQDGPAREAAIRRTNELQSDDSGAGALAALLAFDFAFEYPLYGFPEGETEADRTLKREPILERFLTHPKRETVFEREKQVQFFTILLHSNEKGLWSKFASRLVNMKDLMIKHQQEALNSEYSACFEILESTQELDQKELESLRKELAAFGRVQLERLESKSADQIDDPKFHEHYIQSLKGQIKFLETVKDTGSLIGTRAPSLEIVWSSDESRIRSWTDTEGKVCVVYFSTFGCGPCVKSLPKLKELNELISHNRNMSEKVQFIGLTSEQGLVPLKDGVVVCESLEDELEATSKYIKENEVPWPIVFTQESVFNPAFGVRGVPHIVIIDANGKIRDIFNPFKQDVQNMLKRIGLAVESPTNSKP